MACLLAGCTTVNPYYDGSKKHHRPDDFNNNYIDNWRADQPSFFTWQRARWTTTLPAQDPSRVKVVAPPQGDVAIHFVPAQHWSSRTPWDRNATLWGGFVAQSTVQGAPYSMFFSGDTGFSKDFADIGARFGGFDFSQRCGSLPATMVHAAAALATPVVLRCR